MGSTGENFQPQFEQVFNRKENRSSYVLFGLAATDMNSSNTIF